MAIVAWWIAGMGCYICYDDWQVVSVSSVIQINADLKEIDLLSFLKRVSALGTQGCRVWWHCFKAEWNARDQYTLEETQFFKSTCSLSQNITNESAKLKSFKSKTPHLSCYLLPLQLLFCIQAHPIQDTYFFYFPLIFLAAPFSICPWSFGNHSLKLLPSI